MEGAVPIQTVEDKTEAELICGLVRDAGIACGYRATPAIDSPLHGIDSDGPQEILVSPDDEAAARSVIAEAQP